jgi:DeoR/GlpR family transcriptional regulator of sugar metabolism
VLALERRRRLLQLVRANGSSNVWQLADALGVSPSTVRRDLRDMDESGLLTRVHGGASVRDSALEPVLASRAAQHAEEKRLIGKQAAATVPEGATVLITGGTTTEAMLPHLTGHEQLTVLTNGLNIAYHLARHPQISVVVLGGVLRHEEMSLLGPIAEHVLAEFHVDVAFSSAFGISADTGLSGANVTEAGTDRRMLAAAERLVVLADASKFGRRGPVRLAATDQIDCLVTDGQAPEDELHRLQDIGVDVVVC